MGAQLSGMRFDVFLKSKADGVPAVVGPTGYRYQGKFTNLSCQYRIGEKSLRIKSRVDYGMNKDILTIRSWKNTYLRTFSGIKRYWNASINLARRNGFAESLAGRRYAITLWGEDYKWSSEQSAINFPIQSSGGDQKELGLAMLTARYPELEFAMDLHDGLYFYADINKHLPELIIAAKEDLNNMNYVDAWDWEPLVPLIWDASVGVNWGSKREL
jgi:DNA polymerase I-like protein with 3'-5' exonuclease and polymerase domains